MRTGSARQGGFTYLGALFLLALTGLALAVTGDAWSVASRRARERELLWAGNQYVRALTAYRDQSPGARQFPMQMEELLEDRRFPQPRHHLRQLHADPVARAPFVIIRNAQGRTFDGSGSAAQIDRAAIENGAFSALFRVTDGMKANAGPPTFTPPTGTGLLTVLADALQSQDLALTVRNPLGVVVASSDTSLTPEFAQVISVLHGTYTLTVRNKASVPAPYQLIIVPTVDLQLLSTKPGGAGGGRLMATGSSTGN